MAGRKNFKPFDQLMHQQTRKILSERRGGNEIPIPSNTKLTSSVGTMNRVMQCPLHESGEGHAVAILFQSLLKPFGTGHIRGLHVVRMACIRSESWVSKQ